MHRYQDQDDSDRDAGDRSGAVSGDQFIAAWYSAAVCPKPRKKEFVAELSGWSGRLGDCVWVREDFGSRPAMLARSHRRTPTYDPGAWDSVERLFGTYVDPLSRFSAQFAAVAGDRGPEGLPSAYTDSVRVLCRKVPPIVRGVMAGPRADGVGGVVDSRADSDEFLAESDAHYSRYEGIALRSYAGVLLDLLSRFEDPVPDLESPLRERIDELAGRYGDPGQPPRKPTREELEFVHDLLAEQIEKTPEVKRNPYFTEAYARATVTLLKWVVEGRTDIHAGILYKHLEWARKDTYRADIRRAEREFLFDIDTVQEQDRRDMDRYIGNRTERLADAHARLVGYAEATGASGSSWEKQLALGLLDGAAEVLDAFDSIDSLVRAAWDQCLGPPDRRPANSATADAVAAGGYVRALLMIALAPDEQERHVPAEFRVNSATLRDARRHLRADGLISRAGTERDERR